MNNTTEINIKPIYNTGTVSFISTPVQRNFKKIDASHIKDPKGVIPNGIYKVFRHERKRIVLSIFMFLALIITSIVLFGFFAKWKNLNWFWYIINSVSLCYFGLKFVLTLFDLRGLNSSIKSYRENLLNNSRTTPPFIMDIYIKLHKNQVAQNWLTIAFMFYGIIATLLFWWLKDVNWWIFEFKNWIDSLTPNPDLIGICMVIILGFVLFLHIALTIYRKKRIIDIQSFFGNESVSQLNVSEIIARKNKTYSKIFFISILVILVLPFIVKIIWDKIKKK